METLISLKIAPEIYQQLEQVKSQLEAKSQEALSLVCTEDTLKDVKKVRTEVRKHHEELEAQRKALKSAYMKPYEDFELVYKDVTKSLTEADVELKKRIDSVSQELKEVRMLGLLRFMGEKAEELGISWVTWEQLDCNVTASKTDKKCREEVTQKLEQVAQDVVSMEQLENKELVSHFFLKSLNLAEAMDKAKRQEESQAKAQEKLARTSEKAQQDREVEAENQALLEAQREEATSWEPVTLTPVEETTEKAIEEPRFSTQFTVKNETKARLLALKQFLLDGGYHYE